MQSNSAVSDYGKISAEANKSAGGEKEHCKRRSISNIVDNCTLNICISSYYVLLCNKAYLSMT